MQNAFPKISNEVKNNHYWIQSNFSLIFSSMLDGKEYNHYIYWRRSFSAKCLYISCLCLYFVLHPNLRKKINFTNVWLYTIWQPNNLGMLPVSKLIVITSQHFNVVSTFSFGWYDVTTCDSLCFKCIRKFLSHRLNSNSLDDKIHHCNWSKIFF